MLVIDIMTGKGGEKMTDFTIITGDGKEKVLSYGTHRLRQHVNTIISKEPVMISIEYGKHDIFIQAVPKK